ncbi:MAG: glycoside hydrolase family 15 protein [Phormidesmis sp.]
MIATRKSSVGAYVKKSYDREALEALWQLLLARGTLDFLPLENGLFPAAAVSDNTVYTGYEAVWVRDNIYVAYAHYLDGTATEKEIAVKAVRRLANFFAQERLAFERAISARRAPESQMDRPHIRFDGKTLERIEQPWNHAQNDALGYFLWFFCRLVLEDALEPTAEEYSLLALFPLYFEAIQYWQDADSGHWEEPPKIEASSIGVVVAGLRAMREMLTRNHLIDYLKDHHGRTVSSALLDGLIDRGDRTLSEILPYESRQLETERRYDAALLFLAYPLQILLADQAEQVAIDIVENLQGEYGISRYKGDSFWCKDYQDMPENIRTDISEKREAWLAKRDRSIEPGEEAQWCIFDSMLSAFYGQRYQQSGESQFLERQTHHFNRAIAQLTSEDSSFGALKCPELYYLQSGKWTANDATPLLWTQANLLTALKWMRRSLDRV